MSGEPKGAVRPVIPRELVDQVVKKAKLEGEEMAGLDPSLIIRVILRRYVEGTRSKSGSAGVKRKNPNQPSWTERKRAPNIAGEDARGQLLNKLLGVLHDSLLDDGLTKPMGGKALASRIKTSQHFADELIQELIDRKLVEKGERRIGRRGPRYRLLDPPEPASSKKKRT